jgi:hypothetical protein
MKIIRPSRRLFLRGAAAGLICAPAIVHAGSMLMMGAGRNVNGPFVATGLPTWQTAARNVIAGSANATILMAGDSTTRTAPASAAGTWGVNSVPPVLARAMNSVLPSSCNNVLAGGAVPLTTDNRIGTAWGGGGANAEGGPTFLAAAAATFQFTPKDNTGALIAFDTIEVHYDQVSGFGTFTVNVDGGATLATINTSGTNGPKIATVSCPLGTHTINAVWASGTCVLVGFNAYASSPSRFRFLMAAGEVLSQ